MPDVSDLWGLLPSKAAVASTATSGFHIFTWIFIIAAIAMVVGVVLYIVLKQLKFKYRIVVWEKINNNWEITKKTRAMEIKYGTAGDTVFLTAKPKKYLPRPSVQTGRRTYWFAIREDGEWINIGMGDIDMMMKRARVTFLHPDMRYARTSMQRGMKEEFNKPKFMDKYGHIIIPLAAFALIGLFFWLIADKLIAMPDKVNIVADKLSIVADKFDVVASKLGNIASTSGIRPAG